MVYWFQEWDAEAFARRVRDLRRRKDWPALKAALAEVSESNYRHRAQFPVPQTILVAPQDLHGKRAGTQRVARGTISISRMNTLEAVEHFSRARKGAKLCALVFGNGVDVGGGYKSGASAQEEEICRRCPTLFSSLNKAAQNGYYPFGPSTLLPGSSNVARYSHVLYTPDAVVGRESQEEGYGWAHPRRQVNVSLVTACYSNTGFSHDLHDAALLQTTVRSIFLAPQQIEPDMQVLVLGAWGCGCFGGSATEVAALFAKALAMDKLGLMYDEVHFAVPGAHYETFRTCLRRAHLYVEEI